MLAIKSDTRYRLKQKESNTQRFERNLLKQSKKASHVLLTPLPFQFYFPPQFFLFPSPKVYYFPSSMFLFPPLQFLLFSLLNVFYSPPPPPHLFYIFFHPQIHRPPSDSTSTPHPPYIDPTSTPHRPHVDPTLTTLRPHIGPLSTPHRPHIDLTSTLHSTLFLFNTAS